MHEPESEIPGIVALTSAQAELYRRVLFQHVPGSVYLKDLHGVYIDCNEFQFQMAGFTSRAQIVGKTDYEMPWYGIADEVRATDQRVMTSGIPEKVIETATIADGTTLIMMSHKAPLLDEEGRVAGVIGTSWDITEHIHAQEKERLARAQATLSEAQRKSEEEAKKAVLVFAGSIAHDLRTPLLSIEILNEALKKDAALLEEADEAYALHNLRTAGLRVRQAAEATDQLLEHIHAFITDNLKLLRDSATSAISTTELAICNSARGVNQLMMLYPFEPGQRDVVVCDSAYAFEFRGNFLLFVRILFNLVANALHQIHEKGRGKIYVRTQDRGDHNVIFFKDTAGGVLESDLAHLFEGYMSTKEGGTGVGLAFCKATMEIFGGQMHAQIVEKDCIEFVLIFPKI